MRYIGKSIATMTFVILASIPSLPATAQVNVQLPPLPGLEIHVGRTAPPRLRNERRPERPGRDYTWAQGFWHWQDNDWGWVPGRWDRPEQRGVRWVRARYAREGNVWRYEPGHWSNQRVVEGDDYRRWREENHRGGGRGHGRDRDNDRH